MELLDGLDDAQLAAVTCPTDPVCVLARAGAGKTRVLTRRIAWRAAQGGLDIRRVLAITFTTRAAGELTGRLGSLLGRDSGTTGTFHAIAWRMIQDHHEQRRTTPPNVLENPKELLESAIPHRFKGSTATIATEITWANARGIAPENYERTVATSGRNLTIPTATIAEIHAAYTKTKKRRGVVDFDDLITLCADLFRADSGFAAAQRWRFRHFFVDEYQDVNPSQQQLLDAWLGGREDLFVVGDPNQAIYGFNGADASFLTGFADRYPTATVIELRKNHRSTSAVAELADSILARQAPRRLEHLGTPPTVTPCADDRAEAVTIARRVRSEHAPGQVWRSQAILVRTHAQAGVIAETLTRAGIPVATQGDPDFTDAVRVLSFHAAKGLEWPVVHIAGVEDGFVPDIHARDDATLAEERRLFYVAASRATRQVHLTWARQRRFGDKTLRRTPSRWLAQITEVLADTTRHRPKRETGRVVTALTTRPESDTPRARILSWRNAIARAASIPPTVVLSDRTVEDLLDARPQSLQELIDVEGLGPIKARRYGEELLQALHPGGSR